ncbi:DUF2877 domain-containing protein [Enterococcus caccae]|uniref:DUF2877 domain-containing protein n=1 Tax=Enterococcus caccae ATCC BAA-1240 TaxID=1158612 RepID=R3WRY9_9ENTE|nr:DUF2877 domain-containing protein [Enterococcus caccae]EOL44590.1 hypothetical protein UC7_02133 [Enterococcus caccae ATCC BAA-1240]EOT58733.1 hypothetical protein I580_02905 [Enterococcus caccae ATCC BAA-1240]OJG25921.1 hypothetical protein RU98_GL000798 [Enterococcus caccae]
MRTYQSLSGSQNFISDIQTQSLKGEVHSTFNRTINIICDSGELYTIAAEELDNAPNTLRVTNFFNNRPQLIIKTPVYSQNGRLMIGEIAAIEIQGASEWHYPEIEFPKKQEYSKISKRVDQLQGWLIPLESTGGYLLNKKQATTYEKMLHTMLWQESEQLLAYLKEKQLFQAMKQLKRVIGLGPGLTPSGDDFLVGLALIFTTVHYPYHSLKQWLFNSRNELRKRTNIISFSALDWAIKGVARERIGSFLKELFYGESEVVLKRKMLAVLAIGSTSGGDMLTGMLEGIKLTLSLD